MKLNCNYYNINKQDMESSIIHTPKNEDNEIDLQNKLNSAFKLTPSELKEMVNQAVNSMKETPEEFRCKICNLMIHQPMELLCCGESACKMCLQSDQDKQPNQNCPNSECGKELKM